MPCDDWTHDHNDIPWPEVEGELTINSCERICDYCPLTKRRRFEHAANLRRHVYSVHIDPTPNHQPASHLGVWIKDYDSEVVRRGRRNAKLAAARAGPARERKEETEQSSGRSSTGAVRQKRARKSAPSLLASKTTRSKRKPTDNRSGQLEALETDDADAGVGAANITVAMPTEEPAKAPDASQNPQAAHGAKPADTKAPEGLEALSDTAFEREFKMTEARLEESRLVQRQLLMEAERERRASFH